MPHLLKHTRHAYTNQRKAYRVRRTRTATHIDDGGHTNVAAILSTSEEIHRAALVSALLRVLDQTVAAKQDVQAGKLN